MKYPFTILITFCSIFSYAQAPDIEWQRSLGGTGSEEATTVKQTVDGGYIIAGSASSNNGDLSSNYGSSDCWIVKVSNTGAIEWEKSFGGSKYDAANSIEQTIDGGYIVAGSSESNDVDVTSNHGMSDYWVIKLSSTGIIEWQRALGGTNNDYAFSIKQTLDKGYIVSGVSQSSDGDVTGHHGNTGQYHGDGWVVKLSSSGTIEWSKSFGGSSNDDANSIAQTAEGGYIIAGETESIDGDITSNHGSTDYWIIKINSIGDIEWEKTYGGSKADFASDIKQTPDNGYVVDGFTESNDGDVSGNHSNTGYLSDGWVLKLTNAGVIEWQKAIGGSLDDGAYTVELTKDGGYIVLSDGRSIDGDVMGNHSINYVDACAYKLNSTGSIEWQKIMGGTNEDWPGRIIQTTDGGYIMAAYTNSIDGDVITNHGENDYWIVKLKANALPVTLISFSASLQQSKTVLLSWTTSNEINNSSFTIEKSKDGVDYSSVGKIPANPNQHLQNTYSFTDNQPYTGTSYYRLKQTDKDGKFTYSKVIPMNISEIAGLLIKPNPSSNGKFTIDLGTVKKSIRIRVTDNAGRMVYSKEIYEAQSISFNLTKPKGFYFLMISYDGGMNNETIVLN